MASMVEDVDACLESFNLPLFFSPPHFHASVASSLTRIDATRFEKSKVLASLTSRMETLTIQEVNCKIGNLDFHFPLR